MHWEGKAHTQAVARLLSQDIAIDTTVAELGNMSILTHPGKFGGWTVEINKRFIPFESQWAALRKIADYLLASPRD